MHFYEVQIRMTPNGFGDRQMERVPSTMEVRGGYDRFECCFSESMQKIHLYPSAAPIPPASHASSISAGGPH